MSNRCQLWLRSILFKFRLNCEMKMLGYCVSRYTLRNPPFYNQCYWLIVFCYLNGYWLFWYNLSPSFASFSPWALVYVIDNLDLSILYLDVPLALFSAAFCFCLSVIPPSFYKYVCMVCLCSTLITDEKWLRSIQWYLSSSNYWLHEMI